MTGQAKGNKNVRFANSGKNSKTSKNVKTKENGSPGKLTRHKSRSLSQSISIADRIKLLNNPNSGGVTTKSKHKKIKGK